MADAPLDGATPLGDSVITEGLNTDRLAGAASIQDVSYEQWSAAIPEKYRGDDHKSYWEAVKGKGLSGVLQNYAEAQRYLSGATRLPGKDAKPEEWDALYTKLGRPAKPEEYAAATKPAQMPEGLGWQPEMLSMAYNAFHKAGLTPTQAQAMLDHYAAVALQGHDSEKQKSGSALAEAEKTTTERLTKEWGPTQGPLYARNLGSARAAFRAWANDEKIPEPEIREMEKHYFSTDAELARWAAWVGNKLGERGFEKGDVSEMPDQAQALQQARALMATDAYKDPGHSGHARAIAERDRLFKLAYGTGELASR